MEDTGSPREKILARQPTQDLHVPFLKHEGTHAKLDTEMSRVLPGSRSQESSFQDDGTARRKAYTAAHGIRFLRHEDNKHPDKLLEYLEQEVAVKPIEIAVTHAGCTVFAFPHVTQGLLGSSIISVIAFCLSVFFEPTVMDSLTLIGSTVSSGLFFLLGPYVGLCLARWWQMRMDLLGGLWGAVAELNTWAGIWFCSGSKADLEARALVMRHGLAAHTLLYKGGRAEEDLDDMVASGLLMPHEAAILAPLPSKSQMIFAWQAQFWNRALMDDQGGLGTSPIPHAAMYAPLVLKRIQDGRGAAGGALALVFTQLPFPYLHLLSMLVRCAAVVNAITQGAHTGYVLSEPTCVTEGAVVSTAHRMRYEMQEGCPPALFVYSYVAIAMIGFGWVASVLMYPIIYNGLFSIGVMLSNPLGKDFINFAGSFYQHIMKAEIKGFAKCVDAVNLDPSHGDRWWQGLGKPGAPRSQRPSMASMAGAPSAMR